MTNYTIKQILALEVAASDIIAVRRTYLDIVSNDFNTAILLSQIRYWHLPHKETGKSKLKVFHDGQYWIAKKREDWWEEVRMTPKQIDRSLSVLEDLNLIERKVYKFNGSPTSHIRALMKNIYDAELKIFSEKKAATLPAGDNSKLPSGVISKLPSGVISLTKNTTENTTENTTKTGNQQKDVDIPLKIPDPKTKSFPSENKEEKLKEEKKSGDSNKLADLLEKSKNKLSESAEDCDYLYELTEYQLMHPKEFKNSTHKGRKLTRIASDVYVLYRYWYMTGNPDAGMLSETTFKDIALVNSVLRRLNGNLSLLRDVILHWNAFRSSVEAIDKTKIKIMRPSPAIIIKYAPVASSALFLEKVKYTTDAGGDDDGWGFSDEDIVNM